VAVTQPARSEKKSQPATISRLSAIPGYNQLHGAEGANPQQFINQQRRKSLPSIVKEKVVEESPINTTEQIPVGSKSSVQSAGSRPTKRTETYIIENGVHKLVKSTYEEPMKGNQGTAQNNNPGALSQLIKMSFQAGSATTKPRPTVEQQFEKMYKTESPHLKRKPGMGSTPDVTSGLKVEILPREQVYLLSQRRREELIMERAAAERRKQNHIVLSFGGMKDWIGQHLFLVCFMLFNGFIAVFLMKLM